MTLIKFTCPVLPPDANAQPRHTSSDKKYREGGGGGGEEEEGGGGGGRGGGEKGGKDKKPIFSFLTTRQITDCKNLD